MMERLRRMMNLHLLPAVTDQLREWNRKWYDLDRRMRLIQEALGRIEARQCEGKDADGLADNEFRVFSQWGEDGIIQYLTRLVPIARRVFVEFGVEDYEEANTRFLLTKDNWSGVILDADAEKIARIRTSSLYWRYNLKVIEAFITRDTINALIEGAGLTGPIGLLSIDIDGMDYWVWESLTVVDPAIVVIEYNHRFGADRAVTVPYDDGFERRKADASNIYYGASLKALCGLAERKGYDFVGVNRAGLNAFFVKKELRPARLPALTVAEGFVHGGFSEFFDEHGERRKVTPEDEAAHLSRLPLVDLDEGA